MAVLNEAGLAPLHPPAVQAEAQQERLPPPSTSHGHGGAASWQAPASLSQQQARDQQQPQRQAAAAPAHQEATCGVLSDLAAAMADLDGGEQGATVDQAPQSALQEGQQRRPQAWGFASPGAAGAAGTGWDGGDASLATGEAATGPAPRGDANSSWGAAAEGWDAAHGWSSSADGWDADAAGAPSAVTGGGGLLEQVAADIAALTSRNAALQHEIDSISVASSSGLRPLPGAAPAAAPASHRQYQQQQEQLPPPLRLHVANGKPAPGSGTAAMLLPPTPELSQS